MTAYPRLLSPVRLGPMTLRHRAVMSGHGMGLGDGEVGISRRFHAYLLARAEGGAAMVGSESAPVHESTMSRSLGIRLYQDGVIPSLRRTGDAVRAAGSRLAITLWHGGHKDSFIRGRYALAPSPVPNMAGEVPKEITRAEIKDLVAAYGAAARRCREAGLDAVEVQTSTDYLLGSFLSPVLNRRTDEYGGSFANRIRFVVEILEAVRHAAGDAMAVGIRTSASHGIVKAPHDYDLQEAVAAMKAFADAGLVDYVSVMTGSAWAPPASSIPTMDTPRIQLLAEGKAFKAALKVPVVIAGRIRTPEDAERALVEGACDVIAMARSWIADPAWGSKVESGDTDRIRPCMSCNQACVGFVFQGLPGSCVLNPVAGREHSIAAPEPAALRKRIAVIGGGPAGLEAARVLALRNHDVTLFEAADALGGQFRLAAVAPHRNEMRPALAWLAAEVQRLGVRVVLNTTVRVDDPQIGGMDHVIWAIGGRAAPTAIWRLRPYLFSGIPGTEGLLHGRDILQAGTQLHGRVLVIDEEGGWAAVSLVETIAAMPGVTAVTVTTPERDLGEAQLGLTWELRPVKQRLKAKRVEIMTETLVGSVDGATATLVSDTVIGPFDHVILSTGTAAPPLPDGALAVGDCVAPRGFWAATGDAAILTRTL